MRPKLKIALEFRKSQAAVDDHHQRGQVGRVMNVGEK